MDIPARVWISDAVIHNLANMLGMILRALGCAPDADTAEFAAAATIIIIWTVHFPPSV